MPVFSRQILGEKENTRLVNTKNTRLVNVRKKTQGGHPGQHSYQKENMEYSNNITSTDFNQSLEVFNDLFEDCSVDYKKLALAMIELNSAVYALADHLRETNLTYSSLSSKKQIKG